MGSSKSQNSKKHFHKHFMSPTVSAMSKTTVPRRKVLGENNESFASSFDVQFQKSPILETSTSHCARPSSRTLSPNESSSQFDNEEQISTNSADPSLKPYDPLTNYLSPRPQYLRFKPNRRREINERQQGLYESEGGSFESLEFVQDSLVSPLHEAAEILKNQETERAEDDDFDDDSEEEEEEDEDDEEIEDWEEEKRCSLKGLFKFLLCLVFIALSTSYVPSPMELSTEDPKDGYYRTLNHSLEAISTNLQDGNMGWKINGVPETGFSGVNHQNSYQDFEKFKMVVDDDEVLMDVTNDTERVFEPLNEQTLDKDVDHEGMDFDFLEGYIAENVIIDGEIDMKDGYSDQNASEEGAQETKEELELFGDNRSNGSASGNEETDGFENNLYAVEAEEISTGNAGEELEDNAAENHHHMVEKVEGISTEITEEKMVQDDESSKSSSSMDYNEYKEADDSMFEEAGLRLMMKASYMEFGPIHIVCLGFSAIILAASMVYIYQQPRANLVPRKTSQPLKVHLEEPKTTEKIEVQPSYSSHMDECLQKKVESVHVKPSSTMFFSMEEEETRKELSYNEAPKVELLGEFEFGKEKVSSSSSSSIRSCDRESKTIEADWSTKAISHEESRAHSLSPAKPSFESTDSPSYGSFTAEKKIIKKQVNKNNFALEFFQ